MSERSDNPEREFELLLAAHSNQELTAAEQDRLRGLAADDPWRREELAGIDDVLDVFAEERSLREALTMPAEPSEEADEGFQRLQATGLAAGDRLRARLLHGEGVAGTGIVQPPRRRVYAWALGAAALLAVALILWSQSGTGRPDLDPNAPGNDLLSGTRALAVEATVDAAVPQLSWEGLRSAARYDAWVEDAAGREVLRRSATAGPAVAGTTVWTLDRDDVETLRNAAASGAVFLRVVAKDDLDLVIGASEPEQIQFRD